MPSNPQIVMDSLRRIVQALRRSSSASERESGLTGAQALVLGHVALREGLSVSEVAGLTFTHQSSVSDVASRLEARGLLCRERAADDARRCILRPTVAGRSAAARLKDATAQEKLMQALIGLPADRQAELARGLAALIAAAGLGGRRPVMFFETSASKKRPAE